MQDQAARQEHDGQRIETSEDVKDQEQDLERIETSETSEDVKDQEQDLDVQEDRGVED